MSKDLLSEATRALRETDEASELEARSTRSRVLTGLHQTRVRRRTRVVFLLPIAATFIAVSAWGSANGKAHAILETVEHWLSPPPPVPVNATASAPHSLPVPVPVPRSSSLPRSSLPPAPSRSLGLWVASRGLACASAGRWVACVVRSSTGTGTAAFVRRWA